MQLPNPTRFAPLSAALDRRTELLSRLQAENTDCYRLFHGTNEGVPGLSIDRYGPQLLIQSFHHSLSEPELAAIVAAAASHFEPLEVVYNDRSAANSRRPEAEIVEIEHVCHEIGVSYRVRGRHAGQDPLLFLDMRVGRRFMLEQAKGKSVLNLFAYTSGLGLCAALGGAREVWNVDFASRNLAVGHENAALNALDPGAMRFIQSDFFTAARQLAGLPVKVHRRQKPRPYLMLEPRHFDLVCLDPPRWAKSPFGTVDLIRDYQSLLKPSLLATAEGGTLLCTNNVADVPLDDWLDAIRRCATKLKRPLRAIDLLQPEADFPSPDGQPPLKIAVLQV
ncbi:MAG: class I SAM-dependent rRNA methyltransferase [Candidatus Sericytochromatia bacterium]